MPSAVRPTQSHGLTAQRCGPTDAQYSPRFIESEMPSVVRPAHGLVQHPDVRLQTPLSDAYGHPHGHYRSESPASRPTATETPEAYYSARVDREREVLLSKPRLIYVPAFHAGMHEVCSAMPEQRQVCGFSRYSEEGQRRAMERPVAQYCNGMTPRPEERHCSMAKQPETSSFEFVWPCETNVRGKNTWWKGRA